MAGESSSTHDVFLLDLSESGTTRGDSGFLLKALHESRIRTFIIEDEELPSPRGDEITPALVTAIQASKIAIVVLTGDYHDVSLRRWKILTYILDYFQRNPQLIIPVYYVDRCAAHTDPLDPFSFDEPSPFDIPRKYCVEMGNDEFIVSKVMAQVDNLPGWDFNWYEKNKDKFNWEIASRVSKMLDRDPLNVADYPVGLESRLEEVWWLLKLTSSNREFLKIGFYGIQEGICKSTLARAVYNSIAHLFEVSCFLPDIRENSNTHGLVGVQKMLLSQISGETDIKLENVGEGASMIEDMLRQKDVLLILDDVDSLDQLEALGGGPNWWFSSGSRVIITTREEGWLRDHGNEILPYYVQELNHIEALELLSHKAFEHGNVDPTYTEVLNRAIRYASGRPLVLDMIGSSWYGRSVDECKNALDRLERIPLNDIQSIRDALTSNDIQTIQGALTITQVGRVSQEHKTSHSVSEVLQTSLINPEVSQTSVINPEGSQTTRVAGVIVRWRLVAFAASGVGMICNALSPPFKRSIRGWTLIKFFPYVVFSSAAMATILYSNQCWTWIRRLKPYICYGIFLGISVYSYFYDRAVNGEPEILCLVSNVAFALASLSLSKLFGVGFETGMFGYFLQCFTIQLLTINWKLIFVAMIFGGPLFGWHLSSEPFLLTRITRRFGTIPLQNLNRRFSGGRHVIDIHA